MRKGGLLGLFLGASFITVFEVVELPFYLVYIVLCGKRRPVDSMDIKEVDTKELECKSCKDLEKKVNDLSLEFGKFKNQMKPSNDE